MRFAQKSLSFHIMCVSVCHFFFLRVPWKWTSDSSSGWWRKTRNSHTCWNGFLSALIIFPIPANFRQLVQRGYHSKDLHNASLIWGRKLSGAGVSGCSVHLTVLSDSGRPAFYYKVGACNRDVLFGLAWLCGHGMLGEIIWEMKALCLERDLKN